MKTTLLTPSYNSVKSLPAALESILEQRGAEIEYFVVDGGSTDGTVQLLERYAPRFKSAGIDFKWISEPDRGMYDALNKGMATATGEIIGTLNADDFFSADDIVATIAAEFENDPGIEALYADIRFVKGGAGETSLDSLRKLPTARYCSSRLWRPWMFRFGAMVPHPSFYIRRDTFRRLGGYSLDYRICADFDFELRYLGVGKIRSKHLDRCVVSMRLGGASTASWRSNVEINREDLKSLRSHGIYSCLPLIYLKYLFKIWGFLSKRRS